MQPKDSAKGSGSYWPYSSPLLLVLATVILLARLEVDTRADLNTPQAASSERLLSFKTDVGLGFYALYEHRRDGHVVHRSKTTDDL